MMASTYKDVLSYLDEGGLDGNAQQMIEELIEARARPSREEAYALITDWAFHECAEDLAMLATEPFLGEELPEVICCSLAGTADSIILAQLAKDAAYTGDELEEIAAYAESTRAHDALAAAPIAKGRRLDGNTVGNLAENLGDDALAALCIYAPTFTWDDGYYLCDELCARGMPETVRLVKDKICDCEPWERQLIVDEFLVSPYTSTGTPKPVAATLMQVKKTGGVFNSVVFSYLGSEIAGTAGAIGGLLLSGIVDTDHFNAKWRVLFSDGTRKILRTNQDDKRSWEFEALPSIEDFEISHPQYDEDAEEPIEGGGMTSMEEARSWAASTINEVKREFSLVTGIEAYGPPNGNDRIELEP